MCVQRTSNYSQDLASLSLQCMGGSGCIIGAVRLLYSTIGGGGGGGVSSFMFIMDCQCPFAL